VRQQKVRLLIWRRLLARSHCMLRRHSYSCDTPQPLQRHGFLEQPTHWRAYAPTDLSSPFQDVDRRVSSVNDDKILMSHLTGNAIGEYVRFTVAPIGAAGNTNPSREEALTTGFHNLQLHEGGER
jgi:hypothetical protein